MVAGDPAKAEEGKLSDLGDFESGVGQKGTNASLDYDLGILSGDPAKIAQTLAPEISAQNQQVEQGKATTAQFGNRSGGNNAAGQAMDDRARGNIINLIGGLQQGAAQHAGNLGTYNLSMASPNYQAVAGLKTAGQDRKAGAIGGIAQGAADLLMGMPELGSLFHPAGTGSIGGHSFSLGTNMGGAVNEGYDPSNGAMTINTGR